ncbi:MBL fold metallo-hydrolase [Candidatus Dependentiae bacterium]|nr:MBL fold metallo-hydrolase [Candidatus Dependentiae bacterium]
MKRIRPLRSYGKFICMDGIKHDWFIPVCKTLLHSLKVYFFNKELKKEVQEKYVVKPSFPQRSFEPKITWIGHSTFLIQIAGKNILTDPIFGSLSFIFRRIVPAAIKISDLPPIDYVIISHNHFDHMNSASLLELKKRFPRISILVPMGDKKWFDNHQFLSVSEHMWWDEIIDPFLSQLKFIFLPANHWSQRNLTDKNNSLWGSWLIQYNNFKIYFAGDTSWGNHFEQIGNEFENIDIACLPIAPEEPRSLMQETHINAYEAVQAFIKLKAKILIPMHWGTFHLGFENFHTPIKRLKQSWLHLKKELIDKELKILKFGEMIQGIRHNIILAVKSHKKEVSL